MKKNWAGETVACIASGPSLLQEDVDQVHGRARVIAVNNNFSLAPWADALYASDYLWWEHYLPQVDAAAFAGERWTMSESAAREMKLQLIKGPETSWLKRCINSGYHAIGLAKLKGAARIILLGYDFQDTGGRKHHHADHPKPMLNVSSWAGRITAMNQLAHELKAGGIEAINCTRDTALTCFPRRGLAEAL